MRQDDEANIFAARKRMSRTMIDSVFGLLSCGKQSNVKRIPLTLYAFLAGLKIARRVFFFLNLIEQDANYGDIRTYIST